MTKISIIIPVFNAQDYIRECLESVFNQTFCDWECIIADDGSTDKSMQIATDFANSDQRFKVFLNKHSGNPQNVRHLARLQSSGDWLLDLDADDFLAPDCLEKLTERQKQTNADVVLLQLNLFDHKTHQVFQKIPNTTFDFSKLYAGFEAVMLTVGEWKIAANGLFQKKLYISQELYSNSILNIDEYAQRTVLFEAKTVAFSDASYFYRQHEKSLTKKISENYFSILHTDKLLVRLIVSKFGIDSAEAQKAHDAVLKNLLHLPVYFFQHRNHFSKDEQKRIKTLFLENFKVLSKKDIWISGLHFIKKCVLILPPKAILWIASIYARYKRP